MADFESRKNFNSSFTGLITTSVIFCVLGGLALIGFETLRQLKRLPHLSFRSFRQEKDKEKRRANRRNQRNGRKLNKVLIKRSGGEKDLAKDDDEEEEDAAATATTGDQSGNQHAQAAGIGSTSGALVTALQHSHSQTQSRRVQEANLSNRKLYPQGLGTSPEDWEMGHLYMARQFHASTPSPPLEKYPIWWSWQALRFDDWFYATHTGMDTVVYVRFLRACGECVCLVSLAPR